MTLYLRSFVPNDLWSSIVIEDIYISKWDWLSEKQDDTGLQCNIVLDASDTILL